MERLQTLIYERRDQYSVYCPKPTRQADGRYRRAAHFPDARLENTISARMTLAVKIRELKPRVVILPYWQARHPDHYRCSELGFEACFLAGLKNLDEYT